MYSLARYVLVPCLLLAVGIAGAQPAIGPDVALEAGIQDRYTRTRGWSFADFDADGDIDVFRSSTGDQSRFFWNETE
jgi:hypothetical protein